MFVAARHLVENGENAEGTVDDDTIGSHGQLHNLCLHDQVPCKCGRRHCRLDRRPHLKRDASKVPAASQARTQECRLESETNNPSHGCMLGRYAADDALAHSTCASPASKTSTLSHDSLALTTAIRGWAEDLMQVWQPQGMFSMLPG